jgi:hypothetical protein
MSARKPITNPTTKLPVSPMNIRAGKKLYLRKPSTAPSRATLRIITPPFPAW